MTRLSTGGRIDRDRELRFRLDGEEFSGHPGDTLASAVLAAGRVEFGSSIYRGRPRGVVTAGCTEPNALVQLHGEPPEPMVPATCVELFDGLSAETLSGVGWVGRQADPTVFDKKYVHVDVVVVGAGPAGIAAALAAGRSGARVMLVDEQRELGGSLCDGPARVDGRPATEWIDRAAREFVDTSEARVLSRSTVVGYYDHNYLLIAERCGERVERLGPGEPMQRLWHVRAQRVVLATGAHERPMVFADNDRPGIMLSSAVRSYVNRYAVLPGRRAVVLTTGDSGYGTALDLLAAGAEVPAVVDTRPDPPEELAARVRDAGGSVLPGSAVVGTGGQRRIQTVRIDGLDDDGLPLGSPHELDCDLLAVSGGWSPAAHLFSQAGGELRWDAASASFVPVRRDGVPEVIGAARGTYDLAGCLAQGFAAGAAAATATGFRVSAPRVPPASGDRPPNRQRPLWLVPGESGTPEQWRDHFVDLQRDSTVADVWRAVGAGMRSVEHVKRYTTISTGQDQGKTSSVAAIGVLAEALSAGSPGEVGTTTFRPPYVPVPFALLAGRSRGNLHDPVRTTPMHSWHIAAGAVFEDVGQWRRPRYYPRAGEDMDAAVQRECLAAREGVAMQDVSTLGRIDVVGPDAAEFLNRMYTNGMAKLAFGKARYGMMCTADGMVLDDGVALRLAEEHYLVSTTTGGAARVLEWFEEWLQTEWPHLDVRCTSVTEQWAAVAVVGPDSREVIARLAPDLDASAEEFGFMQVRDAVLHNGIPARICRISFSGELAFEINVAGWYGLAAWEAVAEAGADLGITAYGTETMHVLRAEKGFVIVGQDSDGTVTPLDLGMDWVVSGKKDFVGKRSFARPDTAHPDRKQLVGMLPLDPGELLPEGGQVVESDVPRTPPVPMLGHVTSSYRSAALGRSFAMGLVRDGHSRIGEVLQVPVGGRDIGVEITKPVFYDEEGARRDGRQSG